VDVQSFAKQLAAIPGVIAITLGGSRATGRHRHDSDWDFGLYYRDGFDASSVRALGYRGTVVEPGEWGRLVNGGAWLIIDGEQVDILYRELDYVTFWSREAEAGRFQVDRVFGYVGGMATLRLGGRTRPWEDPLRQPSTT
jgi:predicted nucleotidyltransferase